MKPKLIYPFCLFTLVFLLEATATVRFVSKIGSSTPPYTSWATASDSIQKCINFCQNGDTVYVANGVYKETLIINREISLIGSSMDSTVIDGTGLGNETIRVISNCKIEFFNVIGKGVENPMSTVIFAFVNDLVLKDCKVGYASVGVTSGGSYSQIKGCIISNTNYGIDGECFTGGYCDQYIQENVINSVKGNGIIVGGEATFYIENNIITSTAGSGAIGIIISWINRAFIRNNLISGFYTNIYFDRITDTTFVENVISTNSPDPDGSIYLRNIKMVVRNNIFTKNKVGLRVYSTPKHDYNLYWDNIKNINGETTISDNDIIADPMFMNDIRPTANSNFDFHLQSYSPAIDKGDPNILDVNGSRSDIGMFGGPLGESYTYKDIAPKPPRNLTASVQGKAVTLKWNKNTEADLFRYRVYRDTVPNFIYDTTKIIGVTADTFFVDMLGKKQELNKYYYKLTAIDSAINQSAASEEVQVTITGMAEAPPIVVEEYKLLQNYPNPFNPNTTIPYRLKAPGYVKVMVYNILGELVRVLINQYQPAGYYEINFSPDSKEITKGREAIKEFNTFYYGDIVSGIYLYRIEVIGEGNIPVYSDMKKMLMVK